MNLRLLNQPHLAFQLKLLWNGLAGAVKPIIKHPKGKIKIIPAEIGVWMIGHATVLINFYGTTILTDPVFINWLPFPRRITAAGYLADELPNIDYLLISHAHLDHLNKRSLRQLSGKTKKLVVPVRCSDLVAGLGFRHIIEVDWETTHALPEFTLHSFKPIHWGERYPWQRKNRGYNSYLLQKKNKTIFFCGDSAYGELFKKIGQQSRIDLALLPIGAYAPGSLRRVHMDPFDAMEAFSDLAATYFVPIHWGNFRLSLESPEEPPRILERLSQITKTTEQIYILKNGESINFGEIQSD
ncbi:MAG: MBL fold metallo-hydrolase [Candidatus Doudnabacteria bacterium]|nr:MBL fold metallo-hydrolase [Candidatus Doudnabacteria bacterium]